MRRLLVSVAHQLLRLHEDGRIVAEYAVSTARAGAGEKRGSLRTPRGLHAVRIKIGAGAQPGAVFIERRMAGQALDLSVSPIDKDRYRITSRIIWLTGREPRFNRGGDVDTLHRLIYIHGTPHTDMLGTPCSDGCVRMSDMDVIDLFDQVQVGDSVEIGENP